MASAARAASVQELRRPFNTALLDTWRLYRASSCAKRLRCGHAERWPAPTGRGRGPARTAGRGALAALPVARPHNSFVVLDGGELVTKDCDAPAGLEPSTVSVLDPETLLPLAPALRLPEPSIARLASDGESVIAVGTTVVFRMRLDRDA